jgi:hypothetical protein
MSKYPQWIRTKSVEELGDLIYEFESQPGVREDIMQMLKKRAGELVSKHLDKQLDEYFSASYSPPKIWSGHEKENACSIMRNKMRLPLLNLEEATHEFSDYTRLLELRDKTSRYYFNDSFVYERHLDDLKIRMKELFA